MIVRKSCIFVKIEAKIYVCEKMKSEQWKGNREHPNKAKYMYVCMYGTQTRKITKELYYLVSMSRWIWPRFVLSWNPKSVLISFTVFQIDRISGIQSMRIFTYKPVGWSVRAFMPPKMDFYRESNKKHFTLPVHPSPFPSLQLCYSVCYLQNVVANTCSWIRRSEKKKCLGVRYRRNWIKRSPTPTHPQAQFTITCAWVKEMRNR